MSLDQIEHIVVLLLENRSFDHMLGYLSLSGARPDVDGLKPTYTNPWQGRAVPPFHLPIHTLPSDVCHEGPCVDEQLAGGNQGFITDYAKMTPTPVDPTVVMGYYDASDLPVYDHLARQFTTCDRWFCSIPGPTIPNRLYSLAGRSGGLRTSPPSVPPPTYTFPTIFDYLDAADPPISWRVFAGNSLFSMLRLLSNFRRAGRDRIAELADFFPLAAHGQLPSVTWLEPDYGILSSSENDDHPPTDITRAQRLVGQIYNTLLSAEHDAWSRTLFVLTYDEHGGLFDHVSPPPAVDDPADGTFTCGPRVPAFVISPWVKAGAASHTVFDHTSILKTILQRFLALPNGQVPPMHARVNAATGLGALLSEATARTDAAPAPVPIARTARAILVSAPPATLARNQTRRRKGAKKKKASKPKRTGRTPASRAERRPLNDYQAVLERVGDEVRARRGNGT